MVLFYSNMTDNTIDYISSFNHTIYSYFFPIINIMLNRRYQPRYERTIIVFFSSALATVDTIISLLFVLDCATLKNNCMEESEDLFEFNKAYNSKDFEGTAFITQAIIFNKYKNITQPKEEVNRQLILVFREWHKLGEVFATERHMYTMIRLLGEALESGHHLTVDSLLN